MEYNTIESCATNINDNNESSNLTSRKAQLVIDKVRAKTLFDQGRTANEINKKIFNGKYSLKTLYKWKNLSLDAKSIFPKKKICRKAKINGLLKKKICKMATTKKMSVRKISETLNVRISKTHGNVDEIKMFPNPKEFIFQQDHASSHDSNLSQEWCQANLNNFLNKESTPSKLDDFWPIERLWAILTSRVYREPRPKTILSLKKRIKKCWKEIEQSTLTKLVHQLPLRLLEIEKRNGGRIIDFKGHCKCQFCLNN